jgi:hypothetical protein
LRQVQVTADVGERFGRRLSPLGPHVLQALTDAFQRAGSLGFLPPPEEPHGLGDRLIGGRISLSFILQCPVSVANPRVNGLSDTNFLEVPAYHRPP